MLVSESVSASESVHPAWMVPVVVSPMVKPKLEFIFATTTEPPAPMVAVRDMLNAWASEVLRLMVLVAVSWTVEVSVWAPVMSRLVSFFRSLRNTSPSEAALFLTCV